MTTNNIPFTTNDGFSTTGNITAQYYLGDGSKLSGIAPTVQVYEFANTITTGGYYEATWLASYTPGALTTVTTSVTTTPTLLGSFITASGYPGVTTLPVGLITISFETTKSGGTAAYTCYAEIYKRATNGTETLLNTSDISTEFTINTTIHQVVTDFIATPITLDVTDRIVVKIYATMLSGAARDIALSFDDNTNSGIQLPVLPASVQNFVPYVGATANVDLGTYKLETTGNISSANSLVTGNTTITYNPATVTGTALVVSGANTQGGTGYFDFIKVTNTSSGTTNPSKFLRIGPTGALEVINSGYTDTVLSITEAGDFNVKNSIAIGGKVAVNGPAFSAYANATGQTITSGTQQKVLFQTEEFDTNGNFASSRFTPTVEGYYQLNAEVRLDGASGTGEMMIVLYKNGAEYKRGTNQSGTQIATNFWAMQVNSLVSANGTGDYFEIYVQQTSGGNVTVTAVNNPAITWFNGCMMRGA